MLGTYLSGPVDRAACRPLCSLLLAKSTAALPLCPSYTPKKLTLGPLVSGTRSSMQTALSSICRGQQSHSTHHITKPQALHLGCWRAVLPANPLLILADGFLCSES